MKYNLIAVVVVCMLYFIVSCNSGETNVKEEEAVAKKYCASCHVFPQPSLLDKKTWIRKVLPAMGDNLGLIYETGLTDPEQQVISSKYKQGPNAAISLADWEKIRRYYYDIAPDTMAGQNRPPITAFTNLFKVKKVLQETGFPSTTFLKIDPGNKHIYAADIYDSSISVYDPSLKKLSKQNIHGVIVDMSFDSSLMAPGPRSGVYTNISYINPNDERTGTANRYSLTATGEFTVQGSIAGSLPRPVQVTPCDLDKDGKTDYLVCGFGYKTGEFYWMHNKGDGSFEKKMLWAIPGAIKAYIKDFNHDGLPDIMVLFAQAEEGIYLFTNKGNGEFAKNDLLRFPPVYGSCYFELDDFNGDGYEDILYCCGDNADFSRGVLKNYHGVYIFLNDGKYNFTQSYFFPINGCYKAIARDFDKDGDIDIAAISFFPDKTGQPRESFVYLENKKPFVFTPYTIPEFGDGSWLTMDAGDVDGDGDDDIVIGSLDMKDVLKASSAQQKDRPAFLLLQNQAVK